jgi:hypothetical protein
MRKPGTHSSPPCNTSRSLHPPHAASHYNNTHPDMKHRLLQAAALLATALLLPSCAGSGGGTTTYTTAPAAGAGINNADRISVQVTAPPTLGMTEAEKARVASRITAVLNNQRASRPGATRSIAIHVAMTRYSKGSAVARAMLAGLGQIHIDADVTARSGQQTLMTFPVKKTFAWGGMMGAMTTIADVEAGFAEKVAAGLTGKE